MRSIMMVSVSLLMFGFCGCRGIVETPSEDANQLDAIRAGISSESSEQRARALEAAIRVAARGGWHLLYKDVRNAFWQEEKRISEEELRQRLTGAEPGVVYLAQLYLDFFWYCQTPELSAELVALAKHDRSLIFVWDHLIQRCAEIGDARVLEVLHRELDREDAYHATLVSPISGIRRILSNIKEKYPHPTLWDTPLVFREQDGVSRSKAYEAWGKAVELCGRKWSELLAQLKGRLILDGWDVVGVREEKPSTKGE